MADQVTVTITITDTQVDRLKNAFHIDPGKGRSDLEAVTPVLEGLVKAATDEYLLYVSGERVPGGVRDLRELRLRLLGQRLPSGLPSDTEVAALFHLTTSQARNLLAGTRARYPDEFASLFVEAARTALRKAEKIDKSTFRITASKPLAAFIDDLLSESVARPPERLQDASGRYDLARSTAEDLCAALGLGINEVGEKS